MVKPNFFIVGAPKCGTTAMNDYLAQHPDVFMAKKELHYFGRDLHLTSRPQQADYLDEFKNSNGASVVGEASVWYLYSQTAATEIKRFSPEAKILIMLRNPLHVLPSLHSQHLYDGNEDITDFETAINLDGARKEGRNQPHAVDYKKLPPYLDAVCFTEQVIRYVNEFGSKAVKVVLYDDFKNETEQCVRETFHFLGVDERVPLRLGVVNANKHIRFFALHRFIKLPPPSAQKIVRRLLPSKAVRHRLMQAISDRNVAAKKRRPLDAAVATKLRTALTPEISQLGKLLNRDLSHWLQE